MDKILSILTSKAIFGGFCEKQNLNFPIETWNSISNIGYLLFAVLLSRFKFSDSIYSTLLFFVGVSSFLYHSIFIRGFQILDLSAIYLILSYISFRLMKIGNRINISVSILILFVTIFVNMNYPEFGRNLVFLFVISTIILLIIKFKKDSILSIIIFGFAFAAWLLDSSLLCFSNFPVLNGHVIWHLLTAFGFYNIGKLLEN